MNASDIMVTDVITTSPDTSVREAAEILLENHVSALPVVDETGSLVGVLSEGDLVRRMEIGTERRRSWWLELFGSDAARGTEYIKSHARKVRDVMTKRVVSATEDTSVGEIASLLERNGIKRVPIVRDGKVVGLVSRANLVRAFASIPAAELPTMKTSDRDLREQVIQRIKAQPWGMPWLMNVTVESGAVELWGFVSSEQERQAIRVAAETTPGVVSVVDNLSKRPTYAAV